MHYKVIRNALAFFFLPLLVLRIGAVSEFSSGSKFQESSTRGKEESVGTSDRLIIVYPLNGCANLMSESVPDSSAHGLELQSPIRARDIALNELGRRVNEFRNQLLDQDHRALSPESDSLSAMFDSLAVQRRRSIKLNTQYLNAIQMEIAHVPFFMTDDEMLSMSESLPCVQMVEKDSVKIMADPVEIEPITMDRHLKDEYNTSDQEITNRPMKDRHLQENSSHNIVTAEEVNTEGLMFPNDQLFPDQWHLQQGLPYSIQSQREWANWRGSPGMVIAMIDSGCDLSHPDLEAKKWVNNGEICGDGIDNDKNGYIDDCYGWDWVDNDNSPLPQGSGHGTAAAGIIAASTDNGIGVAGICWDCRIMCLRFIQGVEGRVSNQVSAIDYAAKMGAKISNNSYGGYGFSRLEFEVINRARSFGHLFVSSAGNNNYNTDLPQYDHTPSIYNIDNILAVGASTKSGRKASYSNYGKASVDLFAPGSKIVTTENGGGYAVVSGTSFASPMGVGAAALVWSRYPMLNTVDIIRILTTSCKKSSELNGLAVCGGVLDVEQAMRRAAEVARTKGGSLLRMESQHNTPDSVTVSTKNVTPSTGYTGWLGAFLKGFNRRGPSHTASVTDDEDIDGRNNSLEESSKSNKGFVDGMMNLLATPAINQLQLVSSAIKNLFSS